MKTIIFPSDFSAVSDHAWQHTLSIAEQLNARILILHAFVPEKILTGETVSNPIDLSTAEKNINAYLTEAKQKGISSEIIQSSICEGDFAEILKATVVLENPDLIIMGTNGHNTIYESGSMTARVIGNVNIPTLVIPLNAPVKKIQNLAYASDFEEENMGRLKQLLLFAQGLDAQLSCIHVRGKDKYWSRLQASFYEQLYHLDQSVGRFEFYIINHEDILTALNKFAQLNEIDVLMMLTHDGKSISESYTQHMVLQTDIPIWVMHG